MPAARAATERLTANLNRLNSASTGAYALSLSLGLAQFNPQDQAGLDTLLEQGDAQMYANKRGAGEREQDRH